MFHGFESVLFGLLDASKYPLDIVKCRLVQISGTLNILEEHDIIFGIQNGLRDSYPKEMDHLYKNEKSIIRLRAQGPFSSNSNTTSGNW